MLKNEQDEKTLILTNERGHMQETTASGHELRHCIPERSDKKKRKRILLRLVLLASVVLSSTALGVSVVHNYREQNTLTNRLADAVRNDQLKRAQAVMRDIRKHGYTSNRLNVLEKQLNTMNGLRDAWETVQHYYNLGMYREARTAAAPFTSNTAYRDRADALLRDIGTKELNNILKSAGSLYSQGQRDKAEALIHQVLKMDPSNRDAQALLAMVRPSVPVHSVHIHTIEKKTVVENRGDTAYKKGDFTTAVRLWAGTHSKDDAKKIVLSTNIKKYLHNGGKAFDSGDYMAAIKSFDKVQAFVGVLGIHGTADEFALHKYLSLSYSLLGKQALADGLQKRAFYCFRQSLKYEPSNADAAHGLSVLNEEAIRLYKTAYMISGANAPQACRLYMQASDITQKDTDVYKKIKEHLAICNP